MTALHCRRNREARKSQATAEYIQEDVVIANKHNADHANKQGNEASNPAWGKLLLHENTSLYYLKNIRETVSIAAPAEVRQELCEQARATKAARPPSTQLQITVQAMRVPTNMRNASTEPKGD